MKVKYPDFQLVENIGKGKGSFDLIYRKGDEFIILEAKGGAGKLGTKIVDNKRVSQGTKDYMRGILDDMSGSNLVNDINFSLDNLEVKYFLIQQPMNDSGSLLNTIIKEFDIYGN